MPPATGCRNGSREWSGSTLSWSRRSDTCPDERAPGDHLPEIAWISSARVRRHTREGQVRRPAPPMPPVPAAPRRTPRPRLAPRRRPLLSFPSRARRGTSGALYLQSAPAGLNPLPRSPLPNAARRRDVEDRVPRSGEPRTVSDPEGSSTKRSSPGAAERPGPSRPSWWARGRPARRRVHGVSTQARHGWR